MRSIILAVALLGGTFYTPHLRDGRWEFQSPDQLGWKGYPFGRWTWTWDGRRKGEPTLIIEGSASRKPGPPPPSIKWPPKYDPFAPAQKHNL